MRRIGEFSLWVGHVGDMRNLRAVLSRGILAVVDEVRSYAAEFIRDA